ncbi:MAG: tryptophan halogenase family protein, partial [Chitinophagales bacterium]
MNNQPIKKIIIVGNGTAAWMTAAYLQRTFNRVEPNILLQVIETPATAETSDGAAQSSMPLMLGFLRYLGINEQLFMETCLASFKMASKLEGWKTGKVEENYWHPLGSVGGHQGERLSLLQHALHRHLQDQDNEPSFVEKIHEVVAVCKAGKAPKIALSDGKRGAQSLPYSYHFHTAAFVQLLKKYALSKGVERIEGSLQNITLNKQGHIEAIQTKEQGTFSADLYLDCSGGEAQLIRQKLQENFESAADYLPCDSKVNAAIPYGKGNRYHQSAEGLKPYTTLTALQNGWRTHIPLQTVEHFQYTYSSQFTSKEAAEMELRASLGDKASSAQFTHFSSLPNGKRKRQWLGNCVAIGQAAGKVENIGATNLAWIQLGLRYLLYFFPNQSMATRLQQGYNQAMDELYENIRDFEVLHYCLSERKDSDFWKSRTQESAIPESVQEKLGQWKHLLPDGYEGKYTLFGSFDYVCVLAGMNVLPTESLPLLQYDGVVQETDA